jgi:hypothetical protein
MITISVSGLIKKENSSTQISFFEQQNEEEREKIEKTEITIDKIRQKYGSESILKGAVLNSDIGILSKKSKK